MIVLENEGYDNTFGAPFNDPYLASTLPSAGALPTNYYGIGHFSNDNYVAMISGQAPNPDNQADCLQFVDFPATATVAADGQISDSGCVFPTSVTTVANQLTKAHLTWKGYMQDMGNIPSREVGGVRPSAGRARPTAPSWRFPGTATRPATTPSSTSTRSSTTPPCAMPTWSRSVPPAGSSRLGRRRVSPAWPPTSSRFPPPPI